MLHTLNELVTPAVMERFTLLANHVLGAEPVATEKLRPHAGKRLAVELAPWPGFLPSLPPLSWTISAAGLLEWQAAAPEAMTDLRLRIDIADPATLLASALASKAPPAQIDGEAQLAADVGWLMQNLRWDIAADLERVFPPAVAHGLAQFGGWVAGALRAALARLPALVRR